MRNQIFARKTLAMFEADMQRNGLKRVLGKWALTSMGVGAVVGAGIFVMTGLAAKEYAGPALALSFIVAGLGCAFAALCYAEFASMIPVEGSAYAYSYATMGELFAWIIGWDLILEYAMSAATVAVGWSGYLAKLLGLFHIHFPIWLMNDLHTARNLIQQAEASGTLAELSSHYSSLAIPTLGGIEVAFNLPALLVCLAVTWVLCRGIKEASSTNNIMVLVKVVVILFVIGAGAFYIDTAHWSPFIPARALNSEGNMSFGYWGILSGAAYVFFAYIGFDAVSTQAAEAVNPKKDVPFGILVSLLICTVLYVLVSLVLTGMVKYTDLDITAPMAAAFGAHGLHFAVWIISIAAVAGLTSVLLVTMLGQTRILMAMAKDGLLPLHWFGTLHRRYHTPFRGTLIVGVFIATVSCFTPIDTLANLVNIGTLLAFAMVCIAVWYMRIKKPNQARGFKVPYLPVLASLGILFNAGMMLSLEWENWMRLFIWLGIGIAVYFLYGYRHSVLAKNKQPEKVAH